EGFGSPQGLRHRRYGRRPLQGYGRSRGEPGDQDHQYRGPAAACRSRLIHTVQTKTAGSDPRGFPLPFREGSDQLPLPKTFLTSVPGLAPPRSSWPRNVVSAPPVGVTREIMSKTLPSWSV